MHQAYLHRQRTENVAQISDHLAKSAVWGLRSVIAAGGQMVYVVICVCVCVFDNSFQLSALRFSMCVCVCVAICKVWHSRNCDWAWPATEPEPGPGHVGLNLALPLASLLCALFEYINFAAIYINVCEYNCE